jgi:hypothetical protein
MIVIPAEAGIQKNIYWMPHQVRHDMPTKSKEVLDAPHYDEGISGGRSINKEFF